MQRKNIIWQSNYSKINIKDLLTKYDAKCLHYMQEDIQNNSPTHMFCGTPCIFIILCRATNSVEESDINFAFITDIKQSVIFPINRQCSLHLEKISKEKRKFLKI